MENIIKKFARDVLGCGCTEEVFRHIDHDTDVGIDQGLVADKRINIGHRLLIYIKSVGDPEHFKEELPLFVNAGINDRNAGGFNRFRLVLVFPQIHAYSDIYTSLFKKAADGDERTHLHLIAPDNPEIKVLLI